MARPCLRSTSNRGDLSHLGRSVCRTELSEIKGAQDKTVALLQYISKMELKARQIAGQSAGAHAEMKTDLQFKQKEADLSQQTAEKMEQELRKVKEESEKLAGIDSKIETEMKQLSSRKIEMLGELEKYSDDGEFTHASARLSLPVLFSFRLHLCGPAPFRAETAVLAIVVALRRQCDRDKKNLINMKARLFRQRDTLKSQAQLTNALYTKQRAALQEDETHNSLQKLTQKLASHEQTIFSLREYVESRTIESNYGPVKEATQHMTEELNQMAVLATKVV